MASKLKGSAADAVHRANVCPSYNGTKTVNSKPCPICGGTRFMTEAVGGGLMATVPASPIRNPRACCQRRPPASSRWRISPDPHRSAGLHESVSPNAGRESQPANREPGLTKLDCPHSCGRLYPCQRHAVPRGAEDGDDTMRKFTLAAGMALGLLAMPLIASAQDAPAAPDAGAAAAPATGEAAPAAPAPKKAHHARNHTTKAHHARAHHPKKASTAAPAATDGGDAAPAPAPQ